MANNKISRMARAKINLDLLITGRREDDYHLLDSLVVFADYGDEISVRPAENMTLNITGPFAAGLDGEGDNIILRAARLLKDKFNIQQGANIKLVKNLPVSSGIGGGSADAAATLHALAELWSIEGGIPDLGALPLSLGADVPVCMVSKTLQMRGVGEFLRPIAFDFPLYLLLVNPGVSVSTAAIFRARATRKAGFSPGRVLPDHIATLDQLRDIISSAGNDLEQDAFGAAPEIELALGQIRQGDGCVVSGMSGSGATCYGVFADLEAAHSQAGLISSSFPGWWVKPVRVR